MIRGMKYSEVSPALRGLPFCGPRLTTMYSRSQLGALRLDRDIRSILSHLISQAPYASGSLRESFSRLQQIATLLTLDDIEEADEVLSASGNRLTASEVKAIWALRT